MIIFYFFFKNIQIWAESKVLKNKQHILKKWKIASLRHLMKNCIISASLIQYLQGLYNFFVYQFEYNPAAFITNLLMEDAYAKKIAQTYKMGLMMSERQRAEWATQECRRDVIRQKILQQERTAGKEKSHKKIEQDEEIKTDKTKTITKSTSLTQKQQERIIRDAHRKVSILNVKTKDTQERIALAQQRKAYNKAFKDAKEVRKEAVRLAAQQKPVLDMKDQTHVLIAATHPVIQKQFKAPMIEQMLNKHKRLTKDQNLAGHEWLIGAPTSLKQQVAEQLAKKQNIRKDLTFKQQFAAHKINLLRLEALQDLHHKRAGQLRDAQIQRKKLSKIVLFELRQRQELAQEQIDLTTQFLEQQKQHVNEFQRNFQRQILAVQAFKLEQTQAQSSFLSLKTYFQVVVSQKGHQMIMEQEQDSQQYKPPKTLKGTTPTEKLKLQESIPIQGQIKKTLKPNFDPCPKCGLMVTKNNIMNHVSTCKMHNFVVVLSTGNEKESHLSYKCKHCYLFEGRYSAALKHQQICTGIDRDKGIYHLQLEGHDLLDREREYQPLSSATCVFMSSVFLNRPQACLQLECQERNISNYKKVIEQIMQQTKPEEKYWDQYQLVHKVGQLTVFQDKIKFIALSFLYRLLQRSWKDRSMHRSVHVLYKQTFFYIIQRLFPWTKDFRTDIWHQVKKYAYVDHSDELYLNQTNVQDLKVGLRQLFLLNTSMPTTFNGLMSRIDKANVEIRKRFSYPQQIKKMRKKLANMKAKKFLNTEGVWGDRNKAKMITLQNQLNRLTAAQDRHRLFNQPDAPSMKFINDGKRYDAVWSYLCQRLADVITSTSLLSNLVVYGQKDRKENKFYSQIPQYKVWVPATLFFIKKTLPLIYKHSRRIIKNINKQYPFAPQPIQIISQLVGFLYKNHLVDAPPQLSVKDMITKLFDPNDNIDLTTETELTDHLKSLLQAGDLTTNCCVRVCHLSQVYDYLYLEEPRKPYKFLMTRSKWWMYNSEKVNEAMKEK